jgi:predicted nucleic acid-binding protein
MYLIDTNIISEVRKRERCDAKVATWWTSIDDTELFLSVLVIGEVRQGIERVRPRDAAQAAALEKWLGDVGVAFAGRILGIDQKVADAWGCIAAKQSTPVVDGLLAATALVHDLTLATRNITDIAHSGVKWINPFE